MRLRAVIDAYTAAMKKAAGDTAAMAKSAQGSFADLNKKVGELGSELTRKVTLPLVATGAGALKLASDFETAFAQMVGLAGVAGDEVDGLRESVLKLAQETAVGPQKLAEALYFVRSSGIDAAHAMDVLEASAKASAAGMGEPAVIARTLSAAINAYGAANLSAAEASDVLVAGIRAASFEPDQLAASLGTVIATASTMGITFDNLIGTLAVLSRTGLDAAEATVSLNAVLAMLQNGGAAATTLLESHGLSLKQLRDTAAGPGGVIEAMRLLDKTFGDDQEALATIIPNVRAFRGAMTLLAQDGTIVNKVMADVKNSAGSLQSAFDAMDATEAQRLKRAFVELQVALIRIGAIIAPFAAQLAGGIGRLAEVFGQLPDGAQTALVAILALVAAVGPAAKAFSFFASNMRLALSALDKVAASTQGAAGGLSKVGTTATVAAIAIGIVTTVMLANAAAAREAEQRQLGLAEAIKATGSVAGGLVKTLTETATSNQRFAQALANAGVTVEDLAASVVAGGDAWETMKRRILDAATAAGVGLHPWMELQRILGVLPGDARNASTHLANLGAAGAGAAGGFREVFVTAEQAAQGMESSITATAEQARAWDIASMSAAGLAQGVANLLSMIGALFGATFDVGNAQQDFADAVSDVGSSARSAGGSTRDYAAEQRQLEKATKDVTKAQEELADAEAALVEARKGPTAREKSDAALDVREATLAVKEATKAQAEARKKLLEESKKGKEGDVAGARLDLEAASIRLKRAQDRLTDSQADQNKVLKSGEETSDDVKGALDDLEAAQDRVKDATDRQAAAEEALAKGGSGGPAADHARQLRGEYDRVITTGQNWIQKLIDMGAPTATVISEIDNQRLAVEKLMKQYGDPDGKMQKFLDLLAEVLRLRRLMDPNDPSAVGQGGADTGGVSLNKDGYPIRADGSNLFGGRASGGLVAPFETYEMGEEGPEALTVGATRAPDKLGKHAAASEMSGRSAMGARTFMVGLNGPQLITMGAEPGWVTPNHKLGDVDGKRATGGEVLPGRTYLVGERGPEILTVGGFWQQRTADPTASQSVANYVVQGDTVTPVYGNGNQPGGAANTQAVSAADGPYRMTEQGLVLLVPSSGGVPGATGTAGGSGSSTSSMYSTATNSASSTATTVTYRVGLNGPEVIMMGSQPGWVHSDVTMLEGRANGGAVAAGQTVVVGENGPEIITVGGMVTSRHSATSSNASSVSNNSTVLDRQRVTESASDVQRDHMTSAVAQPWAGPMMAASSMGSQTIVDNRTLQVVVELDGVRVANSLVRLSKESGGLPIRIRASS